MKKPALFILILIAMHSKSTLAHDVMNQDQAIRYLASLTAFGEVCQSKLPQLKPAITASWTTGFDEATRDWVNGIRKSPEFTAALETARAESLPSDAELKQLCLSRYGANSANEKRSPSKSNTDRSTAR